LALNKTNSNIQLTTFGALGDGYDAKGRQMISVNRTDEAEIRQIVDRWVRDLSTRDIDTPSCDASADALGFDMDKWFATWPGSTNREMRCLMIGKDGVAYCHSRNRTGSGMWVRATVALRKIEGEWRVINERVFGLPEAHQQTLALSA
jgi:hypothetical protein